MLLYLTFRNGEYKHFKREWVRDADVSTVVCFFVVAIVDCCEIQFIYAFEMWSEIETFLTLFQYIEMKIILH